MTTIHDIGVGQIQYACRWIETDLTRLKDGLSNIQFRPPYTSQIEGMLDDLENQAMELLSKVREAQRAYAEKPIHAKAPDVDLKQFTYLLSLDAAE